ncbi:hypothetical protein BZA77DRAFT_135583 [Pyronema omphalodes]|nr:hypothetical protein BZA77DRAFT_135583 [Pyronema omphalodes]
MILKRRWRAINLSINGGGTLRTTWWRRYFHAMGYDSICGVYFWRIRSFYDTTQNTDSYDSIFGRILLAAFTHCYSLYGMASFGVI